VAKGYVGLPLFKQAWSSKILRSSIPTQAISVLPVAQPGNTPSAAISGES